MLYKQLYSKRVIYTKLLLKLLLIQIKKKIVYLKYHLFLLFCLTTNKAENLIFYNISECQTVMDVCLI